MKKLSGFTLIELMITIAVGAILMAIAVPSFKDFIQNQQTTSEANTLLGSLMTARSKAMHGDVTFAPANGVSFASGWIVTTTGTNGVAVTILQHEPLERLTASPAAAIVFKQGMGEVTLPVSFVLTPKDCGVGADRQRTLTVALNGSSRITRTLCP
ncbi:type IVa pilus pseudopilin TppE [Uliginosibacterium flavum]|uniref:Type II secretion system protein H n=1 Tax=Uliginosibacterium flavum TaxID=1396831 RepID=A0ABV2TLC4_9RHOO